MKTKPIPATATKKKFAGPRRATFLTKAGCLLLSLTLLLAEMAANAQTNVTAAVQTSAPAVAAPVVVNNATEALGAFLHYEFPAINLENCILLAGSLLALVMGAARFLRKLIPDGWQVNKLGLSLAHAGGELNPSLAKLAAAASETATKTPVAVAADKNP